MNFAEALDLVAREPLRLLDCECALSLNAFLVGYELADPSAEAAIRALLERIPGPSKANACTRAYLRHGGGPTAFRVVLDELRTVVAASPSEPQPAWVGDPDPIEHVRSALSSGDLARVLREPTIPWVANYCHGFLLGLQAVAPARGQESTESLQRFENWLRQHYGEPDASWYELIRVFEAVDEPGLRRLVELWDDYQSTASGWQDTTFVRSSKRSPRRDEP